MSEKASKEKVFERLTPILLVVTIVLAFVVGILWQKVAYVEKGGAEVAGTQDLDEGQGAVPEDLGGKLPNDKAEEVEKVSDKDHIRGSKDAKVFIVEYSDLECPFCASFHATGQQVLDEYGDQVAWVYRHFPLDSIHSRARPAANAAECVADLAGNDAFWSFIDDDFANQETGLSEDALKTTAGKVGVDASEFESCFNESKFDQTVSDHYDSGTAAGVTGTPGSFVMNDKGDVWALPGAVPFEELKLAIDEVLAS